MAPADGVGHTRGRQLHLSVLTAGTDPNLAMHRWSPQSIRLALRDAAEHFDMVLIDVPPIGSSSYGMDLADAAENLIMVIPYLDLIEVHERLKERMQVADLKLLGYIFNGGPSRNHFTPYYPILHDPRTEMVSVAAAQERALPVVATTSVRVTSSPTRTPRPRMSLGHHGGESRRSHHRAGSAARRHDPATAYD